MSSGILPLPVKSCVWLRCVNQTIPLEVLKAPLATGIQGSPITLGFLEDKFEIHIRKKDASWIEVAVYRYRVNLNRKRDDGYILRFFATVTGFDEGPQVSIMNHDSEEAEPPSFFKLSKNILAKINSTHHVFDVFVVAQMLELKNVVEENEIKKRIDHYMLNLLRPKLTEEEFRDLCFILKCSTLKDAFTGRLPEEYSGKIIYIIAFMAKNYAKVVQYLKARYKGKDSKNPNVDVHKILKYVDLEDKDGRPLPFEEACNKYHLVHKVGFDCMKTITSDYLLSFLDNDSDYVLEILELALKVHDEDLFSKAIFSFLNSFREITRSKKFEWYSEHEAPIARLILHSARVWITNNDVYIPGWKQSANHTTAY